MNYEFDHTPLKRPQRNWLRSSAIFAVVLAVTAGVVYLIVPHAPVHTAHPGGEKKATSAAPEKNVPVSSPALSEKTSAPQPEAVSEEKTNEAASAEEKEKSDVPVKGVPWSGDPAVDQPEKPLSPETIEKENAVSAENWRSLGEAKSPWCIIHVVGRGDTLGRLAKKYHTTVQAIREFNRLKSDVIYLGAKLSVVPGPWKIEVSKSARRLKLVCLSGNGEKFFASYDVGIGRSGRTPSENFVISIRLFHPEYLAPDGAVFEYGSAENPLGDYFLKLASAQNKDKPLNGYGIHGSPDDAGVGRSVSHGCIRMRNDEVKQLYLLCPTGTPVVIAE